MLLSYSAGPWSFSFSPMVSTTHATAKKILVFKWTQRRAKQVFVSCGQCVIRILCHRGTFDRLRHHTKQGQNALPFPKPHPKAAGATSGTNFLCLGSLLWIMEIPWMLWWNQSHPSSGTLEAFKRGRLHSMLPIRKSKAFFGLKRYKSVTPMGLAIVAAWHNIPEDRLILNLAKELISLVPLGPPKARNKRATSSGGGLTFSTVPLWHTHFFWVSRAAKNWGES